MVKPIRDYLLVEQVEAKAQKEGLLYIPDTTSGPFKKAKVIAKGDGGVVNGVVVPMVVSVGDTVLYNDYGAVEMTDNGRKCFLITEKNVLAIDNA